MAIDLPAFASARAIIRGCLGLTDRQSLLIFADESTTEVSSFIAEVAEGLGVQTTIILVPIALQRRIPHEIDLSLLAQEVAKEARAILTCVNASPECLAFRERILATQWSTRTRIGHMPGASFEVLQLANIDLDKLTTDCHHLEIAMARGYTLNFISYAPNGTPHELKVDIGGWERLPVASTGVIPDGVWGNVPSGETYIAPIEGSGHGSVVINGSIPGLIVAPNEQMVLRFEEGILKRIEQENNATAQHLLQTNIQQAQIKKDGNWRNLAEIGIGLNPAVRHLTGNMLFDEKAIGTAHIALGSNTFMGGRVDSSIHCDMVVKAPTILIDGKMILDHGQLCYRETDWHENYADVSLVESPFLTTKAVAHSGVETAVHNHQLLRLLRPEPGRVSNCFIGDEETARLAYDLHLHLPRDGGWIEIAELAVHTGLDLKTICCVLHIAWKYGLIKYH